MRYYAKLTQMMIIIFIIYSGEESINFARRPLLAAHLYIPVVQTFAPAYKRTMAVLFIFSTGHFVLVGQDTRLYTTSISLVKILRAYCCVLYFVKNYIYKQYRWR